MDSDISIYDGIAYSPNPELVLNELKIIKQNAQSIINSKSRYEKIVEECDSIMSEFGDLVPQEDTQQGSANIEKILDDRIKKEIDPVRQMVMDIHNALFTKEPSKNEVEQTAKA